MSLESVVLFAVGSPLVVDAEESCARAGIRIVAGIRNVDAPDHVSAAVRVVTLEALDDALRRHPIVVALFTPGHRRRAFESAAACGFLHDATLVDPTAIVARSAQIGAGVYVNAGSVIGGACRIGARVLINRSASIGHHVRIGEYASIGPAVVLAGSVSVGRGAAIGAGAVVLPEVTIGDNAVIGAGSVVRGPVAPRTMVAGNPATLVRSDIEGYNGVGA